MDNVIGSEQLRSFNEILHRYHTGLAKTKQRVVASENWWKLRNNAEEAGETEIGRDRGFVSRSGWLHNVIVSKHADAMEAFPEPNILPREEGDKGQAAMLSSIVPCVLEQNEFEKTYSDAMWDKGKYGTGVYKIVWDSSKHNGLGDIAIESVSLLNLYWEPGITDIQESKYFFHTELCDKDVLRAKYPDLLEGKLKSNGFLDTRFLIDDAQDTSDKATVIEVYYHKGGKLHYVKYVDDVVLFATENEVSPSAPGMPAMAESGLYDHGKYPYEFDPLFPIEGSPCGYGFVDICKSPQTEIDLMKTAFVKNTMVSAMPRYFNRIDGNINVDEFLDLSNPIVGVAGNVDETSLRQIVSSPLPPVCINVLDATINELRETSGNTETATGNTPSGVTAASAIAALQEASGKGSRDATLASYRAYSNIVYLVIELIRQFYDMPRSFRIVGDYGAQQFVQYSNAGIKPQYQGNDFGQDMGFRVPVFDIKVSAQKKSVYTKLSNNEMALQFFQYGFFNPQMADQALMCLDLMDFDGKDALMQKVSRNGTIFEKLTQYMQLALMLAEKAQPDMVEGISQDIMTTLGAPIPAPTPLGSGGSAANRNGEWATNGARAKAAGAPLPGGGK